MGCERCGYTGIAKEYEPEAGFVDVPCPCCIGRDGEQPDVVTEGHDALTQEDIERARTHHGLSAANFLLLAKGHLVRAREKLMAQPWSLDISVARGDVTIAIDHVRGAMEVLKKEQPCKP